MNKLLTSIGGFLLIASPWLSSKEIKLEPKTDSITLHFSNGDKLTGETLSGSFNELLLTSKSLAEPSKISTKDLSRWTLNSTPRLMPADHVAAIEFNNGDYLYAALKEVQDKAIVIDTDYAGEISIPRVFVKNMQVSSQNEAFYEGANDQDSWNRSPKKSWNQFNRTWTASERGILSREIFTSDKFSLSFYANWTQRIDLGINLGAEKTDRTYPSKGYSIKLQNWSSTLNRQGGRDRRKPIITKLNKHTLNNLESAHFQLFVDKTVGRFLLYVDGRVEKEWIDPSFDADNFKDSFRFQTFRDNLLRIDNISVRSWSGKAPRSKDDKREEVELSKEQVDNGYQPFDLVNGDIVIGKISDIKDNKVKIDTDFTPLLIALDRLVSLPLGLSNHTPRLEIGDVRGFYPNGKSLLFSLDKLDGTKATVSSQHFGTIDIDLTIFSSIEFHSSLKKSRGE